MIITGILLYCCTFLITAAVNIQARNAVAGKYAELFVTSIFISSLNIFLLKQATSDFLVRLFEDMIISL